MEQLLTKEQIQSVKGQGFLYNKGTRAFSARIITGNGVLNAEQMSAVAQAAQRFGNGNIALTVRLTLELQGIAWEQIPAFNTFIQAHGLQTGGTGSKVRPIVVCKGTTCSNGLSDTLALGTLIHQRFYEGYREVTLPHKFKIAVGGCPNNCVKPDLNDIGIVAVHAPALVLENCRGCGKCTVVDACPLHAVSVQDGKVVIRTDLCNSCGSCIGKCNFNAVEETQTMYKVYVGGKWGKQTRNGSLFNRVFTQEEALDMIEKALLFFKKAGQSGERFGDAITRLGFEQVQAELLPGDILAQKDSILGLHTKAGAKC